MRAGQSQAERSQRLRSSTATAREEGTNNSDDADNHGDADDGDVDDDGDNDSTICTQQIDNLLVHFSVVPKTRATVQREESLGSGAEDVVLVQSIRLFQENEVSD